MTGKIKERVGGISAPEFEDMIKELDAVKGTKNVYATQIEQCYLTGKWHCAYYYREDAE